MYFVVPDIVLVDSDTEVEVYWMLLLKLSLEKSWVAPLEADDLFGGMQLGHRLGADASGAFTFCHDTD